MWQGSTSSNHIRQSLLACSSVHGRLCCGRRWDFSPAVGVLWAARGRGCCGGPDNCGLAHGQRENWRNLVKSKAVGGELCREGAQIPAAAPQAVSAPSLQPKQLLLLTIWRKRLLGGKTWWKVSRKGKYKGGVMGRPWRWAEQMTDSANKKSPRSMTGQR